MPKDFAPPPPTPKEIDRICRDLLGNSPGSIETLRPGAWSSAMGLETVRGPMVLRFSATDEDFRADANASRYAGPSLPIPHVYGIDQLGERWWCMSQRMPGMHLDDLSDDQLVEVVPSLASMLRAIRDVSSISTTGFGGWDADGNGQFASFGDQLLDVAIDNPAEPRGGGWSENLRPHVHAHSVFDDGMKLLEELVPFVPDVRQLIHQDTINYNVTVAEKHISGIFDWGCAMWGDALYDLAWFRFWNPWYPQWESANLPDRLEALVGIEGDHPKERMQCYLLHIGLGHIRYNAFIENWTSMSEVVVATEVLIRDTQS